MSISGNYSFLSRSVNILLPIFLYCLIISKIRESGVAALVMLPVMILSAFQLVLDYLYGSSVISVDMWLNVATTNSSEVFELLDNLLGSLVVVTALYLTPIVAGVIAFIHKWRITDKLSSCLTKISLGSLFLAVPTVIALCIGGTYHIEKETFPLNAIDNLIESLKRQYAVTNYKDTSSGFSFNATYTGDSCRYVSIVVIGETSRTPNWSLFGYDRVTNPNLDNINGIVGFKETLSQSNTTHKSVPLLLSHLDAVHFGDSINEVKGLITAFKEADFSTTYLSTQQRNNSYIDFFAEEADKCIFLSDKMSTRQKIKDSDMLKMIESEIKNGATKQLIVIHTYGSHFNYIDRYSDRSRKYTPDNYVDADKKYRKELINAYDNTIVETDYFLSYIIHCLTTNKIKSTLIYTSDHGEDIFDDERNRFLHASPTPTYYQLHVPMMIWMSPEYLSINADKYENALANSNKFVSSSTSYFHTILDLANIRCGQFKENLSLISKEYHSPEPIFIDDHNEAVPLIKSGITRHDINKLKDMGINLK